ncbi:ABC transporter permease [Xylanibacillus composti]|uniref:ABC transporter permease n=1 Tax=Xylanibacillus composti TaxID=1572762 RepID=A0A8J4H5T5_9BACL|nr:ABC transporter permease [Xylanibacillus composti]MDT9726859.1 ABC transporter permease [Xylanibacillus composti]GIQ71369.1 ABC transporter permease [Xylanibacillus composti]
MYFRIIRNDVAKSKATTWTTMMFVAAAGMLVSLAAVLAVHLAGALDTLMTTAKTPHFMQMHAGELDRERLAAFAEQHDLVEDFQVLEFLNIDGTQIKLGEQSLAASVQDNGFSIQSEKFDFLLDLDGNIIQASPGELYVPITYMKDDFAKIGDKAVISGKEFAVAGFLRDSQMNATLSASKRFLVSQQDYEAIRSMGSVEYLIAFRLKDLSQLGAFETAYASAGLEANGPTVTYPLFQMVNALSDGMMIGLILLVSMLVVTISLLCIRFTLLAKIEEDYREIGVLKAIGLRVSDIKKIYMAKYAAIATAGCMLGFALAFVFQGMLLANIRLYMGEGEHSASPLLFGLAGILLVFLAIMAYVSRVLNRFRHISAAKAIRFGAAQESHVAGRRWSLSGNRLFSVNAFLGIQDVLARKRLYATMLAVLVMCAFIMAVPQNLHNTISSSSFIQYMGIGSYDMRMDIQQTDHISEKTDEIIEALSRDGDISRYAVLTTKTFQVKTEGGTQENIKIELGDHATFPIAYSAGRAPEAEDEIALSAINADELGKQVGDGMTLVIAGRERALKVSGIYADITNGGKTAKAVFADHSAAVMWSMVCVELADRSLVGQKVSEYADRFAFAKVSDIDEYVAQTFGSTISSVKTAAYAAIVIALAIAALVTLLFMRLLIARDRYAIAVMKALGFTRSDIAAQYAARSAFVLVVSIVVGTLLANTLGELLAGAVISAWGASTFQFAVNPLSAYVLSPLMMAGAVLAATMIGIAGAGRVQISENIKE